MKTLTISAAVASLIALSACGDIASDASSPEAVKATAGQIEANLVTDLSKMDTPELIEFVDKEAKNMTALLEKVTDGPSAEAALEDIRNIVPRLNASLNSLENLDVDNITLNIGNMRKMMSVAQSQIGLVDEVVRISQIPEARAVLEKEFDKIEITHK